MMVIGHHRMSIQDPSIRRWSGAMCQYQGDSKQHDAELRGSCVMCPQKIGLLRCAHTLSTSSGRGLCALYPSPA